MGSAVVTMRARTPTQPESCGSFRSLGAVADDLVVDLHRHRQVERLHALGPRAFGELLAEIGEQRGCQTFIDRRLRAYAELDSEVIKALGADKFPVPPLYEVKR